MKRNRVITLLVLVSISVAGVMTQPVPVIAESPGDSGSIDSLLNSYKQTLDRIFFDGTCGEDEIESIKTSISGVVRSREVTGGNITLFLHHTAKFFADEGLDSQAVGINEALQSILDFTGDEIKSVCQEANDEHKAELKTGLKATFSVFRAVRKATRSSLAGGATRIEASRVGLEAAREKAEEELSQASNTGSEEETAPADTAVADPGEPGETQADPQELMDKYSWLFGTSSGDGMGSAETGEAAAVTPVTPDKGQTGNAGEVGKEIVDCVMGELQRLDPNCNESDLVEIRTALLEFQQNNPGFNLDAFRKLMVEYKRLRPGAMAKIDVARVKKELNRVQERYPNFDEDDLQELITKFKKLKKLKNKYREQYKDKI